MRYACGKNQYGQLGIGDHQSGTNQNILYLNSNTNTITGQFYIGGDAGANHSILIQTSSMTSTSGEAYACGLNNILQFGSTVGSTVVKTFTATGINNVKKVSCGQDSTLFLFIDGHVESTGFNQSGQLGNGSTTNITSSRYTVSGSNYVDISLNFKHSLFVDNDGKVYACGENSSGQLGDGTNTDKSTLTQVTTLQDYTITKVSTGSNHSLFLTNEGRVYSCGGNAYGQLGDGTTSNRSTPVYLSTLENELITDIKAGSEFSLFLTDRGTYYACGKNNNGQLGDGTTTNRSLLVYISNVNFTNIETGFNFALGTNS
tara:strand:- start:1930 stop:2877 length:948 start_codon:yes stop_codon:yes gene_type:complete